MSGEDSSAGGSPQQEQDPPEEQERQEWQVGPQDVKGKGKHDKSDVKGKEGKGKVAEVSHPPGLSISTCVLVVWSPIIDSFMRLDMSMHLGGLCMCLCRRWVCFKERGLGRPLFLYR